MSEFLSFKDCWKRLHSIIDADSIQKDAITISFNVTIPNSLTLPGEDAKEAVRDYVASLLDTSSVAIKKLGDVDNASQYNIGLIGNAKYAYEGLEKFATNALVLQR